VPKLRHGERRKKRKEEKYRRPGKTRARARKRRLEIVQGDQAEPRIAGTQILRERARSRVPRARLSRAEPGALAARALLHLRFLTELAHSVIDAAAGRTHDDASGDHAPGEDRRGRGGGGGFSARGRSPRTSRRERTVTREIGSARLGSAGSLSRGGSPACRPVVLSRVVLPLVRARGYVYRVNTSISRAEPVYRRRPPCGVFCFSVNVAGAPRTPGCNFLARSVARYRAIELLNIITAMWVVDSVQLAQERREICPIRNIVSFFENARRPRTRIASLRQSSDSEAIAKCDYNERDLIYPSSPLPLRSDIYHDSRERTVRSIHS